MMSEKQNYSIRIFNVDYYMAPPFQDFDVIYGEFRAASITQVPIIRIFGSTNEGKKICVHIHGVFPYLYIPFDGTEDPNVLKYQIAANIDKAVNISFGQTSSTNQHVYKVTLVSGIPFYGYHVSQHQFFKIHLFSPALVRKISNLLQSEVILGKLYQPHESHIPYILQFMMDYNLHGMSILNLSNLTYRDNSNNIPKQTYCELEADASYKDIVNILEISQGKLTANPGIAAIWEDEKQRLRNNGEESLIGSCLTLSDTQKPPTKSHEVFRRALSERLAIAEDLQETNELNLSVYPAETPSENSSQDSFVSSQQSFVLSSSFDEHAKNLFDLLMEMGKANLEREEEDSVLSQVKEKEEDEEEEIDLSMSLAQIFEKENLDETLVPQLDGLNDSDEGSKGKSERKRKRKFAALPVVVTSGVEDTKRKLNFESKKLDLTICEDVVACDFKRNEKENIVHLSKKTDELSTAELYDRQTNFQAKEGCSTKFTQESVPSQESQSSPDIFPTESDAAANSQHETTIRPLLNPPTRKEVIENLDKLNIPRHKYDTPFYSNAKDVAGSVEVGHRVLKIPSKNPFTLDEFNSHNDALNNYRKTKFDSSLKWTRENIEKCKLMYNTRGSFLITPLKKPPNVKQAEEWLKSCSQVFTRQPEKNQIERMLIPGSPGDSGSDLEMTLTLSDDETSPILGKTSKKRPKKENSRQITGVSMDNTYDFSRATQNFQKVKALQERQHITIFSLELHVETRGDLNPDPTYDSIKAIFYLIQEDGIEHESGVISMKDEKEIIEELIQLVHLWDPDILIGYEIELLSWGFLFDRGKFLEINMLEALSRVKDKTRGWSDEGLKVTGRVLLDGWRLLRHEVALMNYTFENIAYHLLHRRIHLFPFKNLTLWWKSDLHRHRTLDYYMLRVKAMLEILERLDLIGRTSELAKLFGIQFFEVLSRGSQFRVESMMLRLSKPLNYIPVSPSVQQRAQMKAPEFVPLILEPESKLYVDPVIVLDFQSLYPSMIIAYNYCFSTCLGKVRLLGKNQPFEFGATQLKVSKRRIKNLLEKDQLNFSPCGVAFVKKQVRDGILPRMLREILETRLMVKNSLKKNKDDAVLQKVLHNRQLGLKLIANVTYGYTAASYSGRMPAVDVADSIVSKGRETLQRAIELVESKKEWGARVVYGDTDSLFVLVEGRSREEAFEIGRSIADAVTNDNPDPVKLKLEKVYQPCILQTKKRYVGYMYESAEETVPKYDAKGIETVRRDGCPAVAKILEKCLRLLFETMDVSLIKNYVLRQFDKIITGKVSLQDLTFAKEYRGASGYRPGACVPALELARKWSSVDSRKEPRRKQRIPYVIIAGPPGVPLIRLVRSPHELLSDPSLKINAIYYVTKAIIPPLNRCFNLIGADFTVWFNQMPRGKINFLRAPSPVKKSTISQYFVSNSCACCGGVTQEKLCKKCAGNPQKALVVLYEKLRNWERMVEELNLICQSCTNFLDNSPCISLDCPVLYRLNQANRDMEQTLYVREVTDMISSKLDF